MDTISDRYHRVMVLLIEFRNSKPTRHHTLCVVKHWQHSGTPKHVIITVDYASLFETEWPRTPLIVCLCLADYDASSLRAFLVLGLSALYIIIICEESLNQALSTMQ